MAEPETSSADKTSGSKSAFDLVHPGEVVDAHPVDDDPQRWSCDHRTSPFWTAT